MQSKRNREETQEKQKKYKAENHAENENKKIWDILLNVRFSNNKIPYMSATKTANYLLDDPIIDWLELYYRKFGFNTDNKPSKDDLTIINNEYNKNMEYMKYFFEGGLNFEDKIMTHLQQKFLSNFLMINNTGREGANKDNFLKTQNAIYSGIPILAQAVLFNDMNKTYGVADLIIRSDYLNKISINKIISEQEEKIKAPKLKHNYHYVVIDIKYSLLHFSTKNNTLLKCGRIPAYKGQLAIYNCALGLIQGYFPEKSYIMGRGWKREQSVNKEKVIHENYDCFNDMGVIDYKNKDNMYIQKTAEAIEWYSDVLNNGLNWTPMKPQNKNMYPNMCNDDLIWSSVKKIIAEKNKDPTLIMNVGIKERGILHERQIYSYLDKDCHAQNMGINEPTETSERINSILLGNSDKQIDIYPLKFENNAKNWQKKSPVDFYFDFETINEDLVEQNINIRNTKKVNALIFQIGIGWCENDEWKYKSFCINNVNEQKEMNMVDSFFEFIVLKSKELDTNNEYYPRLFHWTNAEITNLKDINKSQNDRYSKFLAESFIKYIDMYRVFLDEKVYIKGALNYKLKTVGKALFNLGKINTQWPDTDIINGQIAMFEAVKYYRNKQNDNIINDIIKYNEVDCKMIWEIVSLYRNHGKNKIK
jgi:hypothetical protein